MTDEKCSTDQLNSMVCGPQMEWVITEFDADPEPNNEAQHDEHISDEEEDIKPLIKQEEDSDIEDTGRTELPTVVDEENDHDDDDDEVEIIETTSDDNVLRARDGTIWQRVSAPNNPRFSVKKKTQFGPATSTKNLSIRDTFKLLLSPNICEQIITATNIKARITYEKSKKSWRDMTTEEFDAFIGLMLVSGAQNSNLESIKDLWKSDNLPIFRAGMSIKRFLDISRFIRFDCTATRAERLLTNSAAPITEIWSILNTNLLSHYVPSNSLTVGEQLFPFRGKTKFTQVMPSKPGKLGLYLWWICDSKNSYPLTGHLHTGSVPIMMEPSLSERVVTNLCHPFIGSQKIITTSSFYTSLPLARQLLTWDLTLCGQVQKKKAYIPPEMTIFRKPDVCGSVFGFSEDKKVTICSYTPKKNKYVVMLSTVHHGIGVKGRKFEPEMVWHYNASKDAVDNMDKKLNEYTSRRRTHRWTVALFFNMLDIAGLGSYIIFTENNYVPKTKTMISRRRFLLELGRQLVMPAVEKRSKLRIVMQSFPTKIGIESMLGHPVNFPVVAKTSDESRDASGRLKVVGSCYLCRTLTHLQRKTRKSCNYCCRPVCDQHSESIAKCCNCN